MTDIVKRLRAYGGDEMLHQSAADEIMRLRAHHFFSLDELNKIGLKEIERLRDEVERLQAALQEIASMGTGERVRIARRALEPMP